MLNSGIKTPRFIKTGSEIDPHSIEGMDFPLIVKPTDRSGSRGITKVDERSQLAEAVANSCEQSFEHCAIIEEYFSGKEYSCECISFEGRHSMLALTKKHTTDAPAFIETGHDEPSDIPAHMHSAVAEQVFMALDALEIRYGASHTEFRLDAQGNVRIIEIGARMGGDCIGSDLVFISTGMDFTAMVIDVACGHAPKLERVREPHLAKVRFILCDEDYEEYLRIAAQQPESIWRAGDPRRPDGSVVTDSSTRFGYYILALPMQNV